MGKRMLFGLGGAIAGIVIGFAAAFLLGVASAGSGNEMRGVAGVDFGLLFGAPLGALVGTGMGIWWGKRRGEKRAHPSLRYNADDEGISPPSS